MTKEQQIAVRLSGNFSYYRGIMNLIASGNPDWESVRKSLVRFLDTGNRGMIDDIKELEEIVTRKAQEEKQND